MPDETQRAVETLLGEQALTDALQGMGSGDPVKRDRTLRDLTATERVEHIWEGGIYQGSNVTLVNPLLPELRTMFHPYIPLSITGCTQPPSPHHVNRNGFWQEDATVDYFRRHGFPVPPGAPEG